MLHRLASIFLVAAFFESVCSHGPRQHMVCQTLENIFENPDEGSHAEPQRGPRGPKGHHGPPGPPGAVNYEKVEDIVEEKLSSVIRTLQDKIEKLERQVAELNSTSRTSPASTVTASTAPTVLTTPTTPAPTTPNSTSPEPLTVIATTDFIPEQTTRVSTGLADSTPTETMPILQDPEVKCDIGRKILGTCFFAVVPGNSLVSYEEAKMLCAVENGMLAVIEKPRQLAILKTYLRKMIPEGRNYNDFWLGLKYDAKKRRINRMDGTRVPPLRDWFPDYPIVEKERSAVGIEVHRDEKALNQGLFNLALTGSVYGVVCNK